MTTPTMRALVVETLAPDFAGCAVRDVPAPAPGPGQVLVRVKAASYSFPDLLMTRGEYQFKPIRQPLAQRITDDQNSLCWCRLHLAWRRRLDGFVHLLLRLRAPIKRIVGIVGMIRMRRTRRTRRSALAPKRIEEIVPVG